MRRFPLASILVASALVAGCGARTSEDDLLDYWGGDGDSVGVGGFATGGGFGVGGNGVGGIATGGAGAGGAFPTGGAGGSGSCCFTSAKPGCSDTEVAECVCKFDEFCCESSWDQACVDQGSLHCGAGCSMGTGGST